MEKESDHFLAAEKTGRLMLRFAVPCVVSLLVGALYNIVAVSYTHLDVYKRQLTPWRS